MPATSMSGRCRFACRKPSTCPWTRPAIATRMGAAFCEGAVWPSARRASDKAMAPKRSMNRRSVMVGLVSNWFIGRSTSWLAPSLRHCPECCAEDGVEVLPTGGCDRVPHCLFRQCPLIAEIGQRRDHVFFNGRDRGDRLRCTEGVELVTQFHAHAFGGLLADAWYPRQPREIIAADRAHHVGRSHSAENGDRQLRPNAAYGDQLLEELLFVGAQESEQRDRVLADVGMDVQRHLAAKPGQVGKCRHSDGDVITDARRLNDGLVGMLRDQPSAKVRNHLSG